MPNKGSRIPIATRLNQHLHRAEGDGCWEWTAACGRNGYGRLRQGGRNSPTVQAHRVAWELANGPIPEGLLVCHTCDNPRCCRPDHLFLGTHGDNMADRSRKGRAASGARNAMRQHPERAAKGEENGKAKLTDHAVLRIRAERAAGVTTATLAARYHTDPTTIRRIVARTSWRHVP